MDTLGRRDFMKQLSPAQKKARAIELMARDLDALKKYL